MIKSSKDLSPIELQQYAQLIDSIRKDRIEEVRNTVKTNPELLSVIDNEGYVMGIKGNSPLLLALCNKTDEIALIILEKIKVDYELLNYINPQQTFSNTALTLSIKNNHLEVAKKLIEARLCAPISTIE